MINSKEMEGKYFPAELIEYFNSAQEAFSRIATSEKEAEMGLSLFTLGKGAPFIFETNYECKNVCLVLSRNKDGRIGFWLACLKYLSESAEVAKGRFIEDTVLNRIDAEDEPPVIAIFQYPVNDWTIQ